MRALVPRSQTLYLKVALGKGFGYALKLTSETKRTKREERKKKRSQDEDGKVQNLAVLKRIKRAA